MIEITIGEIVDALTERIEHQQQIADDVAGEYIDQMEQGTFDAEALELRGYEEGRLRGLREALDMLRSQ